VSFTDPFGLSPDAGIGEATLGLAAVGLGAITAVYALAHGDDLKSAVGAGYDAAKGLVTSVVFAVSDKVHTSHLAGQEANINTHFGWLAGNGPPGKDPEKWGDKWKKDIEKGLREMRKRLERIRSKADRAKWQDRINDLQQRLDKAQ
jgi:hypothetical protein